MKKTPQLSGSASSLIDQRIRELGDWRGKALAKVRKIVQQGAPGVIEEWKWRGVPCWSLDGLICTGETYKSVVKMTFAKGAALADPARLFNSSLEGNVRRAIDIREGENVNEAALKKLIEAAVALNAEKKAGGTSVAKAGVEKKVNAGKKTMTKGKATPKKTAANKTVANKKAAGKAATKKAATKKPATKAAAKKATTKKEPTKKKASRNAAARKTYAKKPSTKRS